MKTVRNPAAEVRNSQPSTCSVEMLAYGGFSFSAVGRDTPRNARHLIARYLLAGYGERVERDLPGARATTL